MANIMQDKHLYNTYSKILSAAVNRVVATILFNRLKQTGPIYLANAECFCAMKHVRRVKWRKFLGDSNAEEIEKLPKKLMLPSFSRRSPEQLDNEVKAYSKIILTRVRNLKPLIIRLYQEQLAQWSAYHPHQPYAES